eukprot:SAG31_NODE_2105_length_6432_cov_22.218696_5_plen_67_part_00
MREQYTGMLQELWRLKPEAAPQGAKLGRVKGMMGVSTSLFKHSSSEETRQLLDVHRLLDALDRPVM